jgi:gamma-glutamyltranspeptidase/glutathione hydrolase
MAPFASFATRHAPTGMVCSVDHLASEAGVAMLRAGGSAADAAVSANAVLAVTAQNMCGMGGDLFALVHQPGDAAPSALNASGRAGSGADADRLRAEGHRDMPRSMDIRAVPVPGCVDGWVTLHERFGRLPLAEVLEPARGYAEDGFPPSPIMRAAMATIAALPDAADYAAGGPLIRRPGVARTLAAIALRGRDAFYRGEFGEGLVTLGAGEYTADDLGASQAEWVEPLRAEAWGRVLWTIPPNSQGYLTLAAAWIASGLELPDDPDDPVWAHLTIEAARQAGYDRLDVLHEHADGTALLAPDRLVPRRAAVARDTSADLAEPRVRAGGTMYLCAVDGDRMGVSLIQSNASGFGSGLIEPGTRIFLQNRGLGFSLEPGHPAEYGPGRRPPHTLCPALVTTTDGALDRVIGTMGGDSQPQILLQLLARQLAATQSPGRSIAASRWALADPDGAAGFSTWRRRGRVVVQLEADAPANWDAELERRGHRVARQPDPIAGFGHAHVIVNEGERLAGAADPRALVGAATGY